MGENTVQDCVKDNNINVELNGSLLLDDWILFVRTWWPIAVFVWGKQMSCTDSDISVMPNAPRWTWDHIHDWTNFYTVKIKYYVMKQVIPTSYLAEF